MNIKTYENSLRIVAACIVCCLVLNLTAFYAKCESLRADFLRLHIIAASDSPQDQRIKLAVRDAVLEAGADIFDGSITAAEAEKKIKPRIPYLRAAAEDVLSANGKTDSVKIDVRKEFFAERQYSAEMTLPAGLYEAVIITIGEGKGKNWWCVMFPPMCLPAAEERCAESPLTDEERDIVRSPSKYKVKLKIVEWIQELASKIEI